MNYLPHEVQWDFVLYNTYVHIDVYVVLFTAVHYNLYTTDASTSARIDDATVTAFAFGGDEKKRENFHGIYFTLFVIFVSTNDSNKMRKRLREEKGG